MSSERILNLFTKKVSRSHNYSSPEWEGSSNVVSPPSTPVLSLKSGTVMETRVVLTEGHVTDAQVTVTGQTRTRIPLSFSLCRFMLPLLSSSVFFQYQCTLKKGTTRSLVLIILHKNLLFFI